LMARVMSATTPCSAGPGFTTWSRKKL
jgi:hypothetical protein